MIICTALMSVFLYANKTDELTWPKGETFLMYLEKYNIPLNLYYNLEKEDKELCAEIVAGANYFQLLDKKGSLIQVLIPISEEMQLHIYKNNENIYKFKTLPILYEEIEEILSIKINNSPYLDILKATNNKALANEVLRAFSNSLNFRYMRKGDNVVIKYKQKIRLGKYFGQAQIIGALIEINGKKHYIFKNDKDTKYYDEKAKSLTNFFFRTPLSYTRISSRFTKKRWHPILKRYRSHLGVDYAAPRGRKIYAAANGRIIFRGRKGAYGNTIIIKHNNGLKTLYAHQNKFRSGLRVGSKVKKGKHIGYVGSTGLSSGPHLHLGLYKYGRAINPLKVIKITKNKLKGKAKKEFLRYTKKIINILKQSIDNKVLRVTKLERNSSSSKIDLDSVL